MINKRKKWMIPAESKQLHDEEGVLFFCSKICCPKNKSVIKIIGRSGCLRKDVQWWIEHAKFPNKCNNADLRERFKLMNLRTDTNFSTHSIRWLDASLADTWICTVIALICLAIYWLNEQIWADESRNLMLKSRFFKYWEGLSKRAAPIFSKRIFCVWMVIKWPEK